MMNKQRRPVGEERRDECADTRRGTKGTSVIRDVSVTEFSNFRKEVPGSKASFTDIDQLMKKPV